MSVFAQYVPYAFAEGDWDTPATRSASLALGVDRAGSATNIPDAVIAAQVLGPPDIEREVGLTGGHIFQGEILPDYMWDRRLTPETPMPGVFLCGACTHPGGSVIAVNGRNAAMEVLRGSPPEPTPVPNRTRPLRMSHERSPKSSWPGTARPPGRSAASTPA